MINPDHITNYNREDRELEEFMVFSVCVAGKTAATIAKILNPIFEKAEYKYLLPIDYLANNTDTNWFLKNNGIGCYSLKATAICELNKKIEENPDFLKTATIDDLESVTGIGPKTARFFIMHSREEQRVAALDTHILKELKLNGVDCPKFTPAAGKKYKELEQKFIELADKSGMTVADYDLMIWKKHRKLAFDKV